MSKVRVLSFLLGLTCIFAAASCFAYPAPAWEFTSGSAAPLYTDYEVALFDPATLGYIPGQWDFGNTFQLYVPVTVSALGYFDPASDKSIPINPTSDNLSRTFVSHEVALYDSSGNLLASATVLPTDPLAGTHFRYDQISPVLLPVGTYQIDALSHTDNYTYTTDLSVNPSVLAYLGNSYNAVDSSYPTADFQPTSQNDVPYGYWGPDFLLTPVTVPVPEPSTLLLLGSALVGFAAFRKKSKAS